MTKAIYGSNDDTGRSQTKGYIISQRVKFLAYGRRNIEQTGTHAVKEIKYRTYDYKEKGHLE